MGTDWRRIPGNEHAYNRLCELIAGGQALAFVGAGASAELYPLWTQLIHQLADEAVRQGLADDADRTFWLAAKTKPQQAVQGIKRALGKGAYAEALRKIFAPRPTNAGHYFTAAQGILVRLAFRGLVTTNYDRGLITAQQKLRSDIPWTSFATWKDQDSVYRWLTGTIFNEHPSPILFAHGMYEQSDSVVLGAAEYREAYEHTPYRQLFEKLWGQCNLVFVGFGFSDQWLDFIADCVITEIAARSASSPPHIALIGLKDSEDYSIEQRRHIRDAYNADPLFYPVPVAGGEEDHSALLEILEALPKDENPDAHLNVNEPESTPRVAAKPVPQVNIGSLAPQEGQHCFRERRPEEPRQRLEIPLDEWDYPGKLPIFSWFDKFLREK